MGLSDNRIAFLLQAYFEHTITDAQRQELFGFVNRGEATQAFEEHLRGMFDQHKSGDPMPYVDWGNIYSKIKSDAQIRKQSILVRSAWWPKLAAAASIIFIILVGFYYWLPSKYTPPPVSSVSKPQNDVAPGKSGALLTLANGNTIVLDSATDGTLVTQGNVNVQKEGGRIIYNSGGTSGEVSYNTMATPSGRQYALTLGDNTKVWLNASSSIRFPTSFEGKKREVFITGEVYFEVAQNSEKPFIVNINEHDQVEVLGTRFNINSYENEMVQKTTLLEGKVKIVSRSASLVLQPGQQAALSKEGVVNVKEDIDLDEVIAWKNGMFQFDNLSLDAIMRQLARWYDVELEYKGTIEKHFGGAISRDVNLSKVLSMLELTGEVKFKIEGKKIIATSL